jgi:broad specificity phosphatase PhoE
MIHSPFPLLVLFRHGQTNDNAARRFQGHSNTPLNALGRNQARRAGEIVANLMEGFARRGSPLGTCATSDLPRAFETATAVASIVKERLGVELPFVHEVGLREFHVGQLQDHTVEEFEKKHPGVLQEFYRQYEIDAYTTAYPGTAGESRTQLAARLAPLVQKLNARYVPATHSTHIRQQTEHFDASKTCSEIHMWASHGGTIDVVLELLRVESLGNKRIVGNGDVLLLVPAGETEHNTASANSPRERFAAANGCNVPWKLLRHYQVGDNIAAKLIASNKEEA